MMLGEVERKAIVVARPVFEQFLKVFPTSVRSRDLRFLFAFTEVTFSTRRATGNCTLNAS